MPQPTHRQRAPLPAHRRQGVALVIVLLVLVIVSLLGASGMQISMLGERGARNERDAQIAWQSGEAALVDAELDIQGEPASSSNRRHAIFAVGSTDVARFAVNCGTTGPSRGLCALNPGGKPAWLLVDFTQAGDTAASTAFGTFTGRRFASGGAGIQPAQAPRYVIEAIADPDSARTTDPAEMKYVYRVTAMGFGPTASTQAVLQTIYRN